MIDAVGKLLVGLDRVYEGERLTRVRHFCVTCIPTCRMKDTE